MPGRRDRRRDGVGWYGGRSDAGTVAMSVAGTPGLSGRFQMASYVRSVQTPKRQRKTAKNAERRRNTSKDVERRRNTAHI